MISASAGEVFGVEGDGGQGGGAETLGRKRKRFRGASDRLAVALPQEPALRYRVPIASRSPALPPRRGRSWPTPARTALRWGPRALRAGGKGVYLFEMNPATGALTERAPFPNAANPACLALNASGTRLYSANETLMY
jgi:6-phosphogluconolactonase